MYVCLKWIHPSTFEHFPIKGQFSMKITKIVSINLKRELFSRSPNRAFLFWWIWQFIDFKIFVNCFKIFLWQYYWTLLRFLGVKSTHHYGLFSENMTFQSKNTNVNGPFRKVTGLMKILSTDTNSVKGFIAMLDWYSDFFRNLFEISLISFEIWVAQSKTDKDVSFLSKRRFERYVKLSTQTLLDYLKYMKIHGAW